MDVNLLMIKIFIKSYFGKMQNFQLYCVYIILSLEYQEVFNRVIHDSESDSPNTDTWLADESNYYFDYMGDAPANIAEDETEKCPSFPAKASKSACNKKVCQHDIDCKKGQTCCFNGCIQSCMKPMSPPVYIDWIREPRRRLRSGISWLLSGPDAVQDLEPCSTTPYGTDEDPLLCPHGYICHIEKPGDSERNIPNQGHCILENDDHWMELGLNSVSGKMKASSCLMDKYMLLDGAHMTYKGRKCVCKNGFLTCFDRS